MWTTPEVFNNLHRQLGGPVAVLATFGGVDTMLSGKTFLKIKLNGR